MKVPYFAYGSNLDVFGMRRRARSAERDAVATLPNWKLTFRGVADIVRAPGELVEGALWLVTRKDIEALDRYEGTPHMYVRRNVIVDTADGLRPALTYVMVAGGIGLPSPGYLTTIARGYEAWGLDMGALRDSVLDVADQHERLGVDRYVPRGKRMMAMVRGECDARSPATRREDDLEERWARDKFGELTA